MRRVSTSLEDLFRGLSFYFCDFFKSFMTKKNCHYILLLFDMTHMNVFGYKPSLR